MAISTKLPPLRFTPPHIPTKNPPPQNLPLFPFKESSTLTLRTHLNLPNLLPEIPFKPAINENGEENETPFHRFRQSSRFLSVAFPELAFSNTLFFATNVVVTVDDDEPEEKLIGRFRREVAKAGVVRECRRRRFFECSQEKRKRKSREAARRNRKRRPQPKVSKKDTAETSKKAAQDSDDDNWELLDIDLPYR